MTTGKNTLDAFLCRIRIDDNPSLGGGFIERRTPAGDYGRRCDPGGAVPLDMGTLTVIRIPALCLDCGHYLADRARLWITHAAGLAWMLSGSLMDRRGYCVVVLASCLLTAASANYAPYHDPGQGSHKLNDIYNAPVKRYSPSFKSDAVS